MVDENTRSEETEDEVNRKLKQIADMASNYLVHYLQQMKNGGELLSFQMDVHVEPVAQGTAKLEYQNRIFELSMIEHKISEYKSETTIRMTTERKKPETTV